MHKFIDVSTGTVNCLKKNIFRARNATLEIPVSSTDNRRKNWKAERD